MENNFPSFKESYQCKKNLSYLNTINSKNQESKSYRDKKLSFDTISPNATSTSKNVKGKKDKVIENPIHSIKKKFLLSSINKNHKERVETQGNLDYENFLPNTIKDKINSILTRRLNKDSLNTERNLKTSESENKEEKNKIDDNKKYTSLNTEEDKENKNERKKIKIEKMKELRSLLTNTKKEKKEDKSNIQNINNNRTQLVREVNNHVNLFEDKEFYNKPISWQKIHFMNRKFQLYSEKNEEEDEDMQKGKDLFKITQERRIKNKIIDFNHFVIFPNYNERKINKKLKKIYAKNNLNIISGIMSRFQQNKKESDLEQKLAENDDLQEDISVDDLI